MIAALAERGGDGHQRDSGEDGRAERAAHSPVLSRIDDSAERQKLEELTGGVDPELSGPLHRRLTAGSHTRPNAMP